MTLGLLAGRLFCRSSEALGVLTGSQPYFLSGESSRQGKAGAAWGCRPTFPARWPQEMLARQSRSSRGHSLSARYRSRLRRIRKPLPTPAGNPAGSRPTRTSLWPGQFLGKTDACHKPLGKRHPALVLREPPVLRGGLQGVLFPGEELHANGAPVRAEAVKGRAVARKAASLAQGNVPRSRCARGKKGERRAALGVT